MRTITSHAIGLNRRQALIAGLTAGGVALAVGLGMRTNEPQPAHEQLQQAAQQNPPTRNDQVMWSYQELARNNPQNAEVRAILAAAYLQKARETGDPSYYGKAEQVVDQALTIDPQHIDALITKGTLALARHQFREALAIGEQALRISPLVVAILGVIADAQIELGMYVAADTTIQEMVRKRPDLSSFSRVSYIRELYGDIPGAINAMARAVQAGGPASENVEWARIQLGNLSFNQGDLDAAEHQYRISLQLLPDYIYAIAGMARVLAARGEYAAAVKAYQQAILRMPLPEFVIGLGELFESAGQQAAANQQYQLVRAMQQLFTANGVDTDLELALFEADHGQNPQAAVAMARSAYQRRPSMKGADTLAWALYKQGNTSEAATYANQALALGTQDATFFFHAGMIAHANGASTAAYQYLQHSITLNPTFSPLHAPKVYETLAILKQVHT